MKLPKNPIWPMSPWARFEGDDDAGGGGGGGGGPVALVDHEGNFSENWTQHLDEDIRDAECFKLVGNFKELGKQFVEQRSAIGKDKVALLGEDPTDGELATFYDATGRPKTVDDYQYKRPEGVPEEKRSDDRMKELRQNAYENGITQRQFTRQMKLDDARIVDDLVTDDETAVREKDETEVNLKKKWGMAYEERVHIANRFINETTGEGEQRDAFVEKYGRDEMFIEWAAEVGKQLVEANVLIAELSHKAPKEAQAELDEFYASDDYQKFLKGEFERTNPAKHANMIKKVSELMETIHPPENVG